MTKKPVALVTGSARRIGAVVVETLHQAGFSVIIHCHHSVKEAHTLAWRFNQIRANSAWVICADLLDEKALQSIVSQTIELAGRLDVLVNNASLFSKNDQQWEALFATNVKAPYQLSMQAAPHLAKTQGCIVNITDLHAEYPMKKYADIRLDTNKGSLEAANIVKEKFKEVLKVE